jgi:hypothetical protein
VLNIPTFRVGKEEKLCSTVDLVAVAMISEKGLAIEYRTVVSPLQGTPCISG